MTQRDTRRPWRFVLAGVFNTLVSYGGYALGLLLGLGLPLASALGLLMGMAVGFVSQGRFTFRSRVRGALPRYLLSCATMYALHMGVVLGLQRVGVDPYRGGLVAVVLIALLSYFVLRDLVFRADAARPDTAQTNSR